MKGLKFWSNTAYRQSTAPLNVLLITSPFKTLVYCASYERQLIDDIFWDLRWCSKFGKFKNWILDPTSRSSPVTFLCRQWSMIKHIPPWIKIDLRCLSLLFATSTLLWHSAGTLKSWDFVSESPEIYHGYLKGLWAGRVTRQRSWKFETIILRLHLWTRPSR